MNYIDFRPKYNINTVMSFYAHFHLIIHVEIKLQLKYSNVQLLSLHPN